MNTSNNETDRINTIALSFFLERTEKERERESESERKSDIKTELICDNISQRLPAITKGIVDDSFIFISKFLSNQQSVRVNCCQLIFADLAKEGKS